jgi:hypothetical protein
MIKLFGFIVSAKFSFPEPWYVDQKDGSRQYQLIDFSILRNEYQGGHYYGLQVIIVWLCFGITHKSWNRQNG